MYFMAFAYKSDLGDIFSLVCAFISVIRIFIPILLILFGSIDMGKAVMAGKEDEVKKKQTALISKVIAAVIVFLLPTLLKIVLGFVVSHGNAQESGENDWYDCIFNAFIYFKYYILVH